MSEDARRDAYYAYGVDLIRTAGLLLRTTPSVIYRASLLFQRFQASVDQHYRARYMSPRDMADYRRSLDDRLARAQRRRLNALASPHGSPHSTDSTLDVDSAVAASANGAEYLIPNHAQQEMRTGLVPLVDLRAPLDYCLHHLVDQEDIVYLSAACLLIAAKMEDPAVRIRAVVNTCMRLSERRAGVVVNEQQRPPPARYEDFKACVVDAEEVVLHQLGFQTFVESPYKYVLLYLGLLVEPADTEAGDPAAAVAAASSSSAVSRGCPRLPSAMVRWMVRAVQLVNDLPRCRHLHTVPSDVLALYAIEQTCPSDLPLPAQWASAFGVTEATLTAVARVYRTYMREGVGSRRASTALADLRAGQTVAPYRSVSEAQDYDTAWRQLRECSSACGGSGATSPAPFSQYPGQGTTAAAGLAVGFTPGAASIEELRDLVGAPVDVHTAGHRRERADTQTARGAVKSCRREEQRSGAP